MLRRRADPSRDESVWVKGRHSVGNGDIVQVLCRNSDDEGSFSRIRTRAGHEGFIRSQYLCVRPPPSTYIPNASVHRLDGEASTMLRRLAVLSRESNVWSLGNQVTFALSTRSSSVTLLQCVAEGEHVEVLRMNAASEDGFCWVKSACGATGFIRSDYICIHPALTHSKVAPSAVTASATLPSIAQDDLDDTSRASAIKVFHDAIRSSSRCVVLFYLLFVNFIAFLICSASKQKSKLCDLWLFLTQSLRSDPSPSGAADCSLAHFALAEDSLTDLLAEVLVSAVAGEAAVRASTVADALAFLSKDPFFTKLVLFLLSSGELMYLPSFSATKQVILALLLYDCDFASTVCLLRDSRHVSTHTHSASQCSIFQSSHRINFVALRHV